MRKRLLFCVVQRIICSKSSFDALSVTERDVVGGRKRGYFLSAVSKRVR